MNNGTMYYEEVVGKRSLSSSTLGQGALPGEFALERHPHVEGMWPGRVQEEGAPPLLPPPG